MATTEVAEEAGCIYAHSVNPSGRRHPLVEHLTAVAEMAAEFAGPFRASDAARLAGLWHDVGKFNPAFQEYLRQCEGASPPRRGPDHKAAGAQLAMESGAEPLAFLIAGHHGGIQDREELRAWLAERGRSSEAADAAGTAAAAMQLHPCQFALDEVHDLEGLEVVMRLIFSAVVDADFLDTEAHFNSEKAAVRTVPVHGMGDLAERFRLAYARLFEHRADTRVNAVREAVYDDCVGASSHPPGLFRLTVPTGGGKTLSGMAFALRHAVTHGMRRVVVAIPYTSITEQTAATYRSVFGTEVVLEHHSAIDPAHDRDPQLRVWQRLAAENWDAPIVVTTVVQLFESLFSNLPSRTRKLHRLARSVIILDEAQMLPASVLAPSLAILRSLVTWAGSSVVLSTATQPSFERLNPAFATATEIVTHPERHFAALKRVDYLAPAATEVWSWERVAEAAAEQETSLVIVNRRRDGIRLLDLIPGDTLHISTLLCGAHRRVVLADVRRRLSEGEPCRLVATQVVEAGVDLDFPLVLRAVAPLDSVIQAAGRCNREGRVARGQCIVFRPPDADASGVYKTGQDTCLGLLREGAVDFDDPAVSARYSTRFLALVNTDSRSIQSKRESLRFATVARDYRIIDEVTESVIVVYPPMRRRVSRLLDLSGSGRDAGRSRRLFRLLQPFVVSLYPRDIAVAASRGWVDELPSGMRVWSGPYDSRTGVGTALFTEEA